MKKLFIFFFLAFSTVNAQDIPKPITGSYVHDFAKVMTEQQKVILHQRLISLKQKYTIETAIVTIPTTGEYVIDDYTISLGRGWGVGGESNNGLVILAAIDDRKWRIEVGYGLEGDLTDAGTKRLGEDFLVPRFKEQNYYQGFMDLINQIDKQIDPATKAIRQAEEEKKKQILEQNKSAIKDGFINFFLFASFISLFFLIWKWKKDFSLQKKKELEEKNKVLQQKIKKLKSLLDNIAKIKKMSSSVEEKTKVDVISEKYNSVYKEAADYFYKEKKNLQKIISLTKTIDSYFQNSDDEHQVSNILNNLNRFEFLKSKPLSYESIITKSDEILKKFKVENLELFDSEFENKFVKYTQEQKKYFSQLDMIHSDFIQNLNDRNLQNASQKSAEYEALLVKLKEINQRLYSRLNKSIEDKKFIQSFDKSVNSYVSGVLSIAAMSFISSSVRRQTQEHTEQILKEARFLDKSPENIDVLKKFMNEISNGFESLFKEKESYDYKVREEEEIQRKEERRRKEEEEQDRRSKDSYSSSYSSFSPSSSSSSSDSYSGGSFGGGGSSGDW